MNECYHPRPPGDRPTLGRMLRPACAALASSILLAAGPSRAAPTCAEATALAFPSVTHGTTPGTPDSPAPSTCGRGDTFAEWFSFTAPDGGRYEFDAAGLDDTTL